MDEDVAYLDKAFDTLPLSRAQGLLDLKSCQHIRDFLRGGQLYNLLFGQPCLIVESEEDFPYGPASDE